MKGVYRIINVQSIKIGDIEPLCEIENNLKVCTLTKKNIIKSCKDQNWKLSLKSYRMNLIQAFITIKRYSK